MTTTRFYVGKIAERILCAPTIDNFVLPMSSSSENISPVQLLRIRRWKKSIELQENNEYHVLAYPFIACN